MYEINALGGADKLRTVTYSRKAAEKIAEILESDYLLPKDLIEEQLTEYKKPLIEDIKAKEGEKHDRSTTEGS